MPQSIDVFQIDLIFPTHITQSINQFYCIRTVFQSKNGAQLGKCHYISFANSNVWLPGKTCSFELFELEFHLMLLKWSEMKRNAMQFNRVKVLLYKLHYATMACNVQTLHDSSRCGTPQKCHELHIICIRLQSIILLRICFCVCANRSCASEHQ